MDDSVKQQTSDEFLEEMFSELQDQQSFSQIQLPDGADLGSVHRNLMADGQNIAPLIGQTMLPSQYVVDATQFKTPWSSISPLQQPHVLPTTESRTIRQEMQVVLERIEVLTKAFQKLLVWTLEVDKALHTEAREAVVLDKSDEMVTDDSGQ